MRTFIILISIFFLFSLSTLAQNSSKYCYKNIDSDEFNLLIETRDVILLDVRTMKEFRKERILYSKLVSNKESLEFILKDLEKTVEILVYCEVGDRSATAAEIICNELQFKYVFNLSGGINNWKSNGYSTDKSKITKNINN